MFVLCFLNPLMILLLLKKGVQTETLKITLNLGLHGETIIQKKEKENGQHRRMDWPVFRSQTMRDKIETVTAVVNCQGNYGIR